MNCRISYLYNILFQPQGSSPVRRRPGAPCPAWGKERRGKGVGVGTGPGSSFRPSLLHPGKLTSRRVHTSRWCGAPIASPCHDIASGPRRNDGQKAPCKYLSLAARGLVCLEPAWGESQSWMCRWVAASRVFSRGSDCLLPRQEGGSLFPAARPQPQIPQAWAAGGGREPLNAVTLWLT